MSTLKCFPSTVDDHLGRRLRARIAPTTYVVPPTVTALASERGSGSDGPRVDVVDDVTGTVAGEGNRCTMATVSGSPAEDHHIAPI